MIVNRIFMGENWIDLSSPTKEEIDSLVFSHHVDPILAQDLLTPTPRQYAKEYGPSIYAVLHFPLFKHSHSESFEQEIDFVISKDGLITTRYESVEALHYFAKLVEVDEILQSEHTVHSHVFFGLMKEIYRFLFDEIEYMKDWTKEIEKNIFEGYEKEMVFEISTASRSLLNFKRILDPHKTVWLSLLDFFKENFDRKFEKDAKLMLDEWERLILETKNISDVLVELRETNNSILSTKQNEIMKTFTILVFLTFPLSLIAAIFGMNSSHTPIIGIKNDFWVILGLMLSVSLAMFSYFKYKKWI